MLILWTLAVVAFVPGAFVACVFGSYAINKMRYRVRERRGLDAAFK